MSDDATQPRKLGRPSDYTPEIAETICLRMAAGESLRQVCRDDEMPSKSTVLRWAFQREDFRDQYARAREALAEYWAEELIEIADDATNDFVERQRKDGSKERAVDQEVVNRSKLRVDARKWVLSKILPKKYGDRQSLELSGVDGAPLAPILNVSVSRPAIAENVQPRIVDVSAASDKS